MGKATKVQDRIVSMIPSFGFIVLLVKELLIMPFYEVGRPNEASCHFAVGLKSVESISIADIYWVLWVYKCIFHHLSSPTNKSHV